MSKSVIDRVGQTFYRLTVIERAGTDKWRNSLWLCRCSCVDGNELVVSLSSLRSGNTKSCGCLKRGALFTQGLKDHFHYHRWYSMMSRCYLESDQQYANYGGRGIRVYAPWQEVTEFCRWMDENMGWPLKGISFDRWPDNDGSYAPTNVRWADAKMQLAN